jgi:hypothetical protein
MSAKFNIENSSHLKQNTFKVPDGYFDALENRLSEIPKSAPKVISIKPRKKNFRELLSMAAAIVLLVSGVWYFWPSQPIAEVELTQDDIATLSTNGFLADAETAFLQEITIEELEEISMSNADFSDVYENVETEIIEEYYLTTDI